MAVRLRIALRRPGSSRVVETSALLNSGQQDLLLPSSPA